MGLYSIITRADGIVLTGFGSSSNIFNVDHQNHVTHTEPASINSHEPDVATMGLQTNPAPNGVLSLAASLADELERLRYSLAQIKSALSGGGSVPEWYTATGDISQFTTLPAVAVRRERNALLGINSSGTATTIAWDTTVYDTTNGSMVTSGLPTAPVAGSYIVGASLGWFANNTSGIAGDFQLAISRISLAASTTTAIGSQQVASGVSVVRKHIVVETIAHFDAGDQLTTSVLQTSGSSQAVQTSPAPSTWMALIGR